VVGGLSTYNDLVQGIGLRCPAAGLFLRRQWIDFAFRQLWDRKLWSWQRKQGQYIFDNAVNVGTVDVTRGSFTVTGHGTAWTTDLVNHQFRVGLNTPIYTVEDVTSATSLDLTQVYGAPSSSGVVYSIYNAYQTAPSDFQNHVVIYDPRFNWALALGTTQEELDVWDAQRANVGNGSYVCASRGFDEFNTPPLPQFEFWPHQQAACVLPFTYISRPPDLSEPGASLPRMIRGDVLLEMALAQCARWPGESSEDKNPYFNLALAMQHEARAQAMVNEMVRTDDEQMENDVTYTSLSSMNIAAVAWGDSRYMQSHDF
jgi:hypothetical protein